MKIAVLLSGGVDSSVALRLLMDEGHEVEAFYLKIWLEDDVSFLGDCPWEEDLSYVRAICEDLHVPLHILPLQREYYDNVVSYAVKELKAGRTPSPDLFCNKMIKFGVFYNAIDDSYDKVATGHYGKIIERDGGFYLSLAPDPVKDQTYFLAQLSKDQLKRALFPLGDLMKKEVRELAQKYNLPTKDRKDSQGICFLGKIKFRDFVNSYLGEETGEIRNEENEIVLGKHKGFWFYTIGQRTGLGLSGGPWYVSKKDIENNIIYVSHKEYTPETQRDSFTVGEFNWINNEPDKTELKLKLRHGPKLYNCVIRPEYKNDIMVSAEVKLDQKDQGIAPGQFAVFYDNEICLGCGKIIK